MKIVISFILMAFLFSSCRQAPGQEFPWRPYSKQAVEESIAHHKPVVIDFWAEWCPNCHDLDREVFSRPEIQAKLAKATTLRMDVTNQDDPQIQQISQEFALDGVPTVVFLDSRGKEINNARVIGFVTPKEFMESLAALDLLT